MILNAFTSRKFLLQPNKDTGHLGISACAATFYDRLSLKILTLQY